MIDDVSSYSVGNFIPFTEEVYLRLFERQFEAWWPAHLLLLAMGAATLVLAWLGKSRIVAMLLGLSLLVCAATFHFRLYAEITPVGKFFGWAFLTQALLILIWGFVTKPREPIRPTFPVILGTAIAGFSLAIHPLLAILTERRPTEAEYLGMAPDPTMCFALGILLISARPLWFILLFPIPILWAATTSATLHALELPASQSMSLPILTAAALIAAMSKAMACKKRNHESTQKRAPGNHRQSRGFGENR